MTKQVNVLPLPESLNGVRDNEIDLDISHPNSKVLRDARACFVLVLTEVADFYVNNTTKSNVFHVPRFYRLGEHLLKKRYELSDDFNNFLITRSLTFLNEKLTEVPDEGKSIVKLCLIKM